MIDRGVDKMNEKEYMIWSKREIEGEKSNKGRRKKKSKIEWEQSKK